MHTYRIIQVEIFQFIVVVSYTLIIVIVTLKCSMMTFNMFQRVCKNLLIAFEVGTTHLRVQSICTKNYFGIPLVCWLFRFSFSYSIRKYITCNKIEKYKCFRITLDFKISFCIKSLYLYPHKVCSEIWVYNLKSLYGY